MTINATAAEFLLLLGLGFFFGLAFEEFNAQSRQARPGGVRSFPLLALSGALLYRIDTTHLLPVTAGLVVSGPTGRGAQLSAAGPLGRVTLPDRHNASAAGYCRPRGAGRVAHL